MTTITQLSKQDYLKKYLSDGDKSKKKKKKKVTQNSIIKSKIIDDDIDINNMRAIDSDELEIYDLAEEAPQIAGFIDERPEEVRLMSEYRGSKKWKIVADEFGIEDVKVMVIGDEKPNETHEINSLHRSEGSSEKTSRKDTERSARKHADSNSSLSKMPAKSDISEVARKVKREKSDSDVSPPRKTRRGDSDSDVSPPRKTRRGKSDSDPSPPRKSKKHRSSDASPVRKIKKEKSDSDASPPRSSKKSFDSHLSPLRKVKKEKSSSSHWGVKKTYDSDESPPRRKRRSRSDSDNSPMRRTFKNVHESHRKNTRRGESKSSSDAYAETHRKTESSKGSSKSSESASKSSRTRDEHSSRDNSKLRNTLGGKKSGLQNAEELRKELEELKERQKDSGTIPSGRNEAVVVRDRKTGLRIDPKEEARKKREKEEKEAEKLAQYAVWGKGMKQVQDSADKLKDDLYEMSKPLARYAGDKDLDEMLKNKEWDGDPMLEYIRKKRKKKDSAGDEKPQYNGSYMPNRYGIRPGYRWDGVDRSNGYEKRFFEELNAKKAREDEAFKWSTADM